MSRSVLVTGAFGNIGSRTVRHLLAAGHREVAVDLQTHGRIEVVHNDDAALAFANAVDCDEAIGEILFIGGGESCRSYALEFYNRLFPTMGLGPLKPEVLRPGPPYFFGDWVDTTDSQELLIREGGASWRTTAC